MLTYYANGPYSEKLFPTFYLSILRCFFLIVSATAAIVTETSGAVREGFAYRRNEAAGKIIANGSGCLRNEGGGCGDD